MHLLDFFFFLNSIATHEPDKSSSNTALLFNLCLFAEELMDLCQCFVLCLREAAGEKSESWQMFSLMFIFTRWQRGQRRWEMQHGRWKGEGNPGKRPRLGKPRHISSILMGQLFVDNYLYQVLKLKKVQQICFINVNEESGKLVYIWYIWIFVISPSTLLLYQASWYTEQCLCQLPVKWAG